MNKKSSTRPVASAKRPAAPKRTQSLSDQIYDRLKGDIVVCKFRPGEEITEIGIAETYKVGRAPVRAALSRLCQDRLLVAVRRRGHVVAPITAQSIQDVFRLRLILEPAAARAAVGRVDVELLRSFVANPGPLTDRKHALTFLHENQDFHLAIIRACGNERLERILYELYDEMSRMLHLGLYAERDSNAMRVDHDEQEKQHNAIIDAFATQDADAVEAAIRSHIESSQSLAIKAILSGRLPFTL